VDIGINPVFIALKVALDPIFGTQSVIVGLLSRVNSHWRSSNETVDHHQYCLCREDEVNDLSTALPRSQVRDVIGYRKNCERFF
jgi:hypothetical protein